jgi:hypothetical protein
MSTSSNVFGTSNVDSILEILRKGEQTTVLMKELLEKVQTELLRKDVVASESDKVHNMKLSGSPFEDWIS